MMLSCRSLLLLLCMSRCQGRRDVPRSSWSLWRRIDVWGLPQSERTLVDVQNDKPLHSILWQLRGGDETVTTNKAAVADETSTTSTKETENIKKAPQTLDQRVRAALQKFGLGQPPHPPPPPPSVVEEVTTNNDATIAAQEPASLSTGASSENLTVGGTEAIPSEAMATSTASAPAEASKTVCEDGVCPMPDATVSTSSTATSTTMMTAASASSTSPVVQFTDSSNILNDEDYYSMAQKIATDMGVHSSLSMAALIATRPDDDSNKATTKNEHLQAARSLIEQELERINQIKEDAPEVRACCQFLSLRTR